jgi:hypothetical protein
MGAIRHLAAAAVMVLFTVSGAPCLAGEAADLRLASLGYFDGNGANPIGELSAAPARKRPAAWLQATLDAGWSLRVPEDDPGLPGGIAPVAGSAPGARRPAPAVSLDPRVPAAQPTDRKGISLIGVAGVVGELRHAFSRNTGEQPADQGVSRLVRTLRDSVFGKRISILSESGRISENNPCLVGFSFTH